MKKYIYVVLCLSYFLMINSCIAQETLNKNEYTFRKHDPNGIGKWYMEREIARVMGFQGIEWLNRPEREQEESSSKLLKNMNIGNNDIIADIGAGSGYHVFKMAEISTSGLIYAVDIQDEMLAELRQNREKRNAKNVKIVKGSELGVNLPKNTIDKVLMVDVYHEFNFPKEMILSIKEALRKNGKIYLIEYRGEDVSVPIKKIHKMSEKQAIEEMKASGMRLERNIDNLPWQHCMVFVKE
jgi:precorrin-6B methylase 2